MRKVQEVFDEIGGLIEGGFYAAAMEARRVASHPMVVEAMEVLNADLIKINPAPPLYRTRDED